MEPTIVEQVEVFKSEAAAIGAELAKVKADLAAAESLAADAEKATAEAKAELATAQAELAAVKESVATVTTAREKAEFDRDAAKAEQSKAVAALADLQLKVASNPAFVHAAAGRPAVQVESSEQGPDLWAQFNSLTDPVSRGRFWQQHGDQLKLIAKQPK